jgi:hypothetical protein
MSDIQRWGHTTNANGDYTGMSRYNQGGWVTYADHVEALRQARSENAYLPTVKASFDRGYEQGQRDALAGAVQRVEALLSREPWQQVEPVIAAIKGGEGA